MCIVHTHGHERKVDMLYTDPPQQSKIKYIMNSTLTLRSRTETDKQPNKQMKAHKKRQNTKPNKKL